MRIKLDTSAIRFMITKPAAPKMDRETRQQKVDKTHRRAAVAAAGDGAGRDRRGDPDRHPRR